MPPKTPFSWGDKKLFIKREGTDDEFKELSCCDSFSLSSLEPEEKNIPVAIRTEYEIKAKIEPLWSKLPANKSLFSPPKPSVCYMSKMNTIKCIAHYVEHLSRIGILTKRYAITIPDYELYKALQAVAHKHYNCNLKRALRMFGCKSRVLYRLKNGDYVYMK